MATDVDRRWWTELGLVVGLGALVRLLFVFVVARHDEPLGDQLYYSAQALTNARGNWFEQPFVTGAPAADHPPLTSALLTPITWISESTGSFVTAQRLMMVLVGVVAIVLVALIGRRVGGARVGLIAAAITAVYANVWVNDGLVMAESPAFLLVAATTLVALKFMDDPTTARAAMLGALVGSMALTRAELLLALPLVLILVIATGRSNRVPAGKSVAALVVAALVVLLPWVAWNQTRFSDSVFLSTNDGLTVAGANCDRTYFDDVGSWDIWCAYDVEIPENADASEASRLMRREGLHYLSEHAGRFPVVVAARMARVMSVGYFGSVNAAGEAEGRPSWVSILGAVQFWLLVPVAAVGFRSVGHRVRRLVLVAFWPVVFVTVVAANAYVRFRLPAEVGLVVLAACGVVALSERSRSSFASG